MSKLKWKNPITLQIFLLLWWFFKKMVPLLSNFLNFYLPRFRKRREFRNDVYSARNLWNNIFLFLRVLFGAFSWFLNVFYWCLPFLICFLHRFFFIFMTKWNTRQAISSILPWRITNPWKLINPKKPKILLRSWKVKTLGGLHSLVVREHSSGSVKSDMTLYYAQYKHTKFGYNS